MKREIIFSIIAVFVIIMAGCAKDNYDAPSSMLTGAVTYNGVPVSVKSGGPRLELWQYGYQTREAISVYIAQDGTYSAQLFDGNYKLVRVAGAPWAVQTDTISITVSGSTNVDVPVIPNYAVSGEIFANAAGVISASGLVTKIGTLNADRISLFIGKTSIVDATNNAAASNKSGGAISNLSVPLTWSYTLSSTLAAKDYIYARIGVRCPGVTEWNYSSVQKIMLK